MTKTRSLWKAPAFIVCLAFVLVLAGCRGGGRSGSGSNMIDLAGEVTITPAGPVAVGTVLTAHYDGHENVTFQWRRGNINIGTAQADFVPTEAGNYTVVVGAAGFRSKTSNTVAVYGVDGYIGINASGTVGIRWAAIPAGTGGTTFPAATGTNTHIRDIASDGNNTFVAVGADGRIARSINAGATWAAVENTGFTGVINGIAYGSGAFVAVGAGARIMRSINGGTTWHEISGAAGITGVLRGIAYGGNNTFIAVGAQGMTRSMNGGITWVPLGSIHNDFGTDVSGIASNSEGTFIAMNTSGAMAFSGNSGNTWGVRPAAGFDNNNTTFPNVVNSIRDIAYGDGTFIAVGLNGRMARSTNGGQTWAAIHPGFQIGISGISDGGSTFLSGSQGNINAIVYGGGVFLAVGNIGRMARSTDGGLTWAAIPAGTGAAGDRCPC